MAIRKGSSYKDRPTQKKTLGSKAFEHALDFELMVLDRMSDLGMKKSDLADKMGISRSGLSNFLNSQPNMTLETMTRFEIALDVVLDISLTPVEAYEFSIGIPDGAIVERILDEDWSESGDAFSSQDSSEHMPYNIAFFQPKDPFSNENFEAIGKSVLGTKEHMAA